MMRRSSALLAACLGLLAAGSVHGQPRNAPAGNPGTKTEVLADPVAEYAAQLTKIDSWLRGLVGQFRLSLEGTGIEGTADCAGIGAGPGVHCILGFSTPGQKGRTSTVMLFGVDTADTKGPRVHRFQLSGDSTAEMSVSRLKNDAVTFQVGDCPVIDHYPPVVRMSGFTTFSVLFCRRESRVLVEPSGRFVQIRQSTSERVLVCSRPGPCEIKEFATPLNMTLERMH